MAETPFNRLKGDARFINVDMNAEAILLPDSGQSAIGTENLNGCSSIVVLGTGIILSHVAPSQPGVATSEVHYEKALARIDALIEKHRDLFPRATTVWGIFGKLQGEAMQHIVQQVNDHFTKKRITTQQAFYEVAEPSARKTPGAGQIVVNVGETGTSVFLENRLLEIKGQPRRKTAPVASTSHTLPSTVSAPARNSGPSGSSQMASEARDAKTAYTRMMSQGATSDQTLQTMVQAFMRNHPGMSKKDATAAVFGRLRYQA